MKFETLKFLITLIVLITLLVFIVYRYWLEYSNNFNSKHIVNLSVSNAHNLIPAPFGFWYKVIDVISIK